MLLSTIIPVYNKERALRQTLQSVVDNHEINDSEYECILIDDESTDSCADICREFCRQYKYFKYIRIFNDHPKVPSTARNVGIKYSDGKYIHFLDADDLLCSPFYKECVDIMDRTKSNILVRGRKVIYPDGDISDWFPTTFKNKIYGPPLGECLFSRELIKNIQFDNIPSEDICFSAVALMNNNYEFYDDLSNTKSYIYDLRYSETGQNYPDIFPEQYDKGNWVNHIVRYLQQYEKYPYKFVDGEIKLKECK